MADRHSPTSELEAAVAKWYQAFPYPDPVSFATRFTEAFEFHCAQKFSKAPPLDLSAEIAGAVAVFYEYERPKATFEPEQHDDTVDHARYRDRLLACLKFASHDHDMRLAEFRTFMYALFEPIVDALPRDVCITAEEPPEYKTTAPLAALLADTKTLIDAMLAPVTHLLEREQLFNKKEMGGRVAQHIADNLKQRKPPFDGTPILALFQTPIPVPMEIEEDPQPGEPAIAERAWLTHALLLAQTGAGKTNAIRWRLAQLLPHVAAGKASIILMEPKGDLIDELLHYAPLYDMRDRLVILDPTEASVSVNLFEPPADASPAALNDTIDRVTRVLNTITLTMTELQKQALTLSMRAMYAMGNPSMRTLMTILRQGKAALDLSALPLPVADFFEHDFRDADGRFIIQRLNGLLSNPIFETLFTGERTTFDMLTEINRGKLVVINSGRAPDIYGQFWIQEIDRCLRPRMAMPEPKRTPTFLIIDEAATYVADDLHFARMLDMARGARMGMLVANQHLGQIKDDHVRNSLLTNTALKFVAHTSGNIFNLCRSMGTTEPDFLNTIPQYHFAFFGPNMTQAELVRLPLVEFHQRMSAAQYDELRRLNRERCAGKKPAPAPELPPQEPETAPVEDLALADAYAQLALAVRCRNSARAAELQDHINSLLERERTRTPKPGPTEGPTTSSGPPRSEGSTDWR